MPLGYFTDSTPLTPLRDPFNVLVDGINAVETAVDDLEDARAIQTFRWADATERNAQTGMQAGDVGYQSDNRFRYEYSGSSWDLLDAIKIIRPTLITGGTLGGSGVISFSSITSLSVDNAFSSTGYPFYDVELVHTGPSGVPSITMLLRASGSDLSTGYDRVNLYGQGSSAASSPIVNGGSWLIAAGERNAAKISVINPALALPTQMRAEVFTTPAVGTIAGMATSIVGGQHRSAVACDGFRLNFSVPSTGTITLKGRF